MASGKSVAKKEETDLVEFDPSMFEEDAGDGLQDMGQDDLALPFLKILSGNDPVLDEREDLRKGDIYNTVTGEAVKGKEGIRVIPCYYQRRFIRWAPRGTGTGAPVAIYDADQPRPRTERSSEDNKDYVVDSNGDYIDETHQHFVLVLRPDGGAETALIAMKSTQLKKSRKWNSMIASRQMNGKNGPFTPPRYSHVYTLTAVHEENSKGSWHGWEIGLEGPITDAGLYKRAKDFATSVGAGDVVVKHEDESGSGAASGGSRPTDDEIPF